MIRLFTNVLICSYLSISKTPCRLHARTEIWRLFRQGPGIHPAKFADVIEPVTGSKIEMLEQLRECLKKEKQSIEMENEYESLKSYLAASYD